MQSISSIRNRLKPILKKLKSTGMPMPKKQENEPRKVKKPRIRRTTAEFIPYTDVHDNGSFITKKGLCDIFRLKCSSILTASQEEQEEAFSSLNIFYKAYIDDFKIVSMNFPADISEQLTFLQHKIQKCTTPQHLRFLEYKKNEFHYIEENESDRDFYIFIYAKDEWDYSNKISVLKQQLQRCFPVETLPLHKKISILYKMYNPNTKLIRTELAKERARAIMAFHESMKEVQKRVPKAVVNPFLIGTIQPQTGLRITDRCIKKGDGYEACIHIYDYPKEADSFWLSGLMSRSNTIITMDISTMNSADTDSVLDDAIKEVTGTDTEDVSQIEDASTDASRLLITRSMLKDYDDVMKQVAIRIYVNAKTQADLEIEVRDIVVALESDKYRCSVYLGEEEDEYTSMMLPYKQQLKLHNKRISNDIVSSALALGYPYNYSSLSDPNGQYLGEIMNGGHMLFDLFHNDSVYKYTIRRRLSYDGVLVGNKGSGKSTTLKKLIEHIAILGNKVRGIDVADEFGDLVAKLNGLMINMDGSEGLVNLLEVFSVSDNEMDSFSQHMSKMAMVYNTLNPQATNSDCLVFKKMIRRLYILSGLLKEEEKSPENPQGYSFPHGKITGLSPELYPCFTDLVELLKSTLYEDIVKEIPHKHLTDKRKVQYQDILDNMENLVDNYGHIFDGHSSIQDLGNEQILFFNIRSLTEMEKNIFAVQMLNIFILIWGGMMKNGAPQKREWNKGNLLWEDVIKYFIVIDEAHRIINQKFEFILDYILNFVREARKYFTSLFFATPSMRLFVPENAKDSYVDKVKDLFDQTTYKFIMLQDSNAIPGLKRIFEGQITESELEQVAFFNQGEALLSIKGTGCYHIMVDANEDELSMFGGGA